MRRIAIAVISVLVMLVAVAWAGAARPRREAFAKCVPGHSHLIAVDARAQVYLAPVPGEAGAKAIYGCAYGRRRSYLLGRSAECGDASSGCGGIGHEALIGTIAGYEELSLGENHHSWLVVVRDLRSGHVLHKAPTGTPRGVNPSEGLLVGVGPTVAIIVKSNGSVAWIAENEIGPPRGPAEYEVHALDSSGSRMLAFGSDIDPHSLVLAGSTLYWTQGGKPFSATLK